MRCDLQKQFSVGVHGHFTDAGYMEFLESMVTSLEAKVEILTSTNIQSMQCSHEFFVRNNRTVKCKKCGGVYDTYE